MPGISLRPTLLLGGLVLACAPGLVHGQGRDAPYRILDPHPTRVADPEPVEYRFVVMGDHAYYAGWGDLVGVELFRAALSSANVELVCDVYPGAMGSHPYGLTVMGNRLYFFAGDAAHGFELWVSDGSVAGTRMVVDLYPGVASSLVPGTRAPAPIGVLGGQLLFGAETGDGQYSLWRSDGSVSGTRRLAHLGAAGARTPLLQFQAAGAFACFVVPDASISGVTVWRTDGLGSGTWPILALPDSSPAVGEVCSLSAAGDQIYVTNRGGLWRVDASAQSAERILVDTGQMHVGLGWMPNPGQPHFYFSANTQIWRTDGTPFGTGPFYPRRGVGVLNSIRQEVVVVNGRLFFWGFDLPHGEELWSMDGTQGGTGLVADLHPGPMGAAGRAGFGLERRLVSNGGVVYFAADDGQTGVELYMTDGTRAGTRCVSDVHAGPGHSNPRRVVAIGASGVAFVADEDGQGGGITGLYVFQPGAAVRKIASNFVSYTARTQESRILGICSHDDRVFFAASDGVHGSEPWVSDGSQSGTRRIADLWVGQGSGVRHHDWANGPAYGSIKGVSLGKDMFFTGYRGDREFALFKTDGTSAGTVHVRDLMMVNDIGWQLHGMAVGQTLYSHAVTKAQGEGLYRFDSDSLMTLLAKVRPGVYCKFGNRLVFTDGSPPSLRAVWITDGSLTGTRRLLSIGRVGLQPFCMLTFRGKVLFSTMERGGELWETDGTLAGTRVARRAAVRSMAVSDDRLFTLEEFHGTVRLTVSDLPAGSGYARVLHSDLPVNAQGLCAVGSKVFFQGFAGEQNELWVSDGGALGTQLVRRFAPAASGASQIDGMQPLGSRRVVFRVEPAPGVGVELWESDGTAQGTQPIADIHRGPAPGVDAQLAQAGGKIVFCGDDGRSGSLDGDLWVADVGAVTYRRGEGCAASGFPPTLSGTDAVLGNTLSLQVDGAPSSFGVILVGAEYRPALELGFGCRLFVDPGLAFATGFRTSRTGRVKFAKIQVPNVPGNLGSRFSAQAALGFTGQRPWRTDLSNGLTLVSGF